MFTNGQQKTRLCWHSPGYCWWSSSLLHIHNFRTLCLFRVRSKLIRSGQ